jgi:hypothetical protein
VKTESYFRNGELIKRQHEIIPKGKRPHWVKELKCWLLLDKKLTKKQAKVKENRFVERYREDEWRAIFK